MNEHRLEEQVQRRGDDDFRTVACEPSLKELVDVDLKQRIKRRGMSAVAKYTKDLW